jgi:nucleolar protein 16
MSVFVTDMNRDRTLTMTQNYKLLGLSSRLNVPTGGSEVRPTAVKSDLPRSSGESAFALPKTRKTTKLVPTEVKVERDPDTGAIMRVIRPEGGGERDSVHSRRPANPLGDLLNEDSDMEELNMASSLVVGVIPDLQAQAEEEASRKKKPRQQSKREEEWIERLIEKYGDNTRSMARDMTLNPMQQSEGDLKQRVRRWKERHQIT